MTLALETVEERDMLSVEAFILLLKRDRRGREDLDDSWGDSKIGVLGGASSSGRPAAKREVLLLLLLLLLLLAGNGDDDDDDELALFLLALARAFLRELSLVSFSSSPCLSEELPSKVEVALKDKARRSRPLRPPDRTIDALGTVVGSPSWLSSLLILSFF